MAYVIFTIDGGRHQSDDDKNHLLYTLKNYGGAEYRIKNTTTNVFIPSHRILRIEYEDVYY